MDLGRTWTRGRSPARQPVSPSQASTIAACTGTDCGLASDEDYGPSPLSTYNLNRGYGQTFDRRVPPSRSRENRINQPAGGATYSLNRGYGQTFDLNRRKPRSDYGNATLFLGRGVGPSYNANRSQQQRSQIPRSAFPGFRPVPIFTLDPDEEAEGGSEIRKLQGGYRDDEFDQPSDGVTCNTCLKKGNGPTFDLDRRKPLSDYGSATVFLGRGVGSSHNANRSQQQRTQTPRSASPRFRPVPMFTLDPDEESEGGSEIRKLQGGYRDDEFDQSSVGATCNTCLKKGNGPTFDLDRRKPLSDYGSATVFVGRGVGPSYNSNRSRQKPTRTPRNASPRFRPVPMFTLDPDEESEGGSEIRKLQGGYRDDEFDQSSADATYRMTRGYNTTVDLNRRDPQSRYDGTSCLERGGCETCEA